MRAFLLVLLMMALPFQSVWSAAAALCVHEQKLSSPHFGHHAAHHDEQQGGSAQASEPASAALDDHHHLPGVNPIPAMPAVPSAMEAGQGVRPPGAERYPHASIATLERPPREPADIRSAVAHWPVQRSLMSGDR